MCNSRNKENPMETSNAFSGLMEALSRVHASICNDTRVMTCGEAAYVLKKTPQTISRYIEQGKLHRATGNGVTGVKASDVYKMVVK